MKNDYQVLGDIVEIRTRSGDVILIDLGDLDKVRKLSTISVRRTYYAHPNSDKVKYLAVVGILNSSQLALGNYLLELQDKTMAIRYKDGDKFNITRDNMEIVTLSEHRRTSKRRSDNTSGCRGVSYHAPNKRWVAVIYVQGEAITLGNSFLSYKDAVQARQEGEFKYYGKVYSKID